MKIIFFIICATLLCCGKSSVSTIKQIPTSRLSYWESTAAYCHGYPSKQNCDDGDMTLFGGLLCAAGDERGCQLVRDSQDMQGRFWRSPRRNPGNLGESKSFSRDQASGVFLYLASTHDRDAANRWMEWIEKNRPCLLLGPMGNCLLHGPFRFCTDEENQMCSINPANWAVLARVFQALDLPLNSQMENFRGMDSAVMIAESRHAPLGYQTHLVAVEVLLKQILKETPSDNQRAAKILHERQPLNPFYSYLDGDTADNVESRLLELCPDDSSGTEPIRRQWAWERDTAEQAWRESMLWDCIFLAKLNAAREFIQ